MSFLENRGKNDYFTRLELDDEDGNEYTDRWNTGELLCLASAVQRSGDKNWVSVSRSIKPFGEPKRPADWYTPKNCALQYSKLLKGVEDFKKKSLPRTERETSEELLVKNLTDKRITELNWANQQIKVLANSLRVHMELLESGDYDEHLDEISKQMEELDKKDEEDYKEWLVKREALNATKKLNKCRVPLSKGKAPSRGIDTKRKNSPNPDLLEDISMHSVLSDVVVKTEIETDHEFSINSKPIHIKQEIIDTPSSVSALLESPKASNFVPPSPLPTTPTSPLLTSLLRSVPSSNATSPVISSISSPLKEADAADSRGSEIDMAALIAKSQEMSPRASTSLSPRPTPASSPLLNSLLKNSPSSVPLSSIQLTQTKEVSPSKVVSSPQPFFNPTSALATAAAQQLAVATSSLTQNHIFFPQDTSENQKRPQPSTTTSACLSAPTLSKLLEMPPSTPGRLPPLPVIETGNTVSTVPIAVSEQVIEQSPPKKVPTAAMLLNELELQISSSPVKKPSDATNLISSPSVTPLPELKKIQPLPSVVPVPPVEVKTSIISSNVVPRTPIVEEKIPFKRPGELDDTSQENIDILEAVCESINQAFEKKEIKQDITDADTSALGKVRKESSEESSDLIQGLQLEKEIPDEIIDAAIDIEKLISSDIGLDEKVFSSEDISDPSNLNIFEDDKEKNDEDAPNPPVSVAQPPPSEAVSEVAEEEKISGRKFYKSRTAAKKIQSTEEDSEKSLDAPSTSKHGTKRPLKSGKNESDILSQVPVNELILMAAKEAEEETVQKTPEKSPTKSIETRSPVAKKPRLFEKAISKENKEKKELSEDETPAAKRPGRKAKKGRKVAKSTPVKQDEPKDQYEFSESTEENSVGYQTTNTLCYMPRLKEDSRSDDCKGKQMQASEGSAVVSSSPDKKHSTPTKGKSIKHPPQSSARKSLFTSDEERMSDSMTSDDASNSHFSDDKLKKWKDYSEKKELMKEEDDAKQSQKGIKQVDSPKKKLQHTKRNLFSSKSEVSKKEKKIVQLDMEESSVCSRDSEDAASTTAWQREDGDVNETKDAIPIVADDVEVEASDSHMSSSMTVESDNKMDEMEGSESLQGSVSAEFSPLPQSDMKEEKDLPQFGKQDWYQGTSPKSSEPVSQSSEESEYESDNWDNHSVSTNKSGTHSAGPSKSKRKERESPQYKAWKKAISIVLREASCHKYANVFLQKVTNDVAPGYLNIVYRPMDLSLLKKNVDNGVVKTTAEVHRDMLLMFQNAVMYNSSDHDVHHMAIEMQRDVIQQIQAFLTTQYNDKDESNELTSLRGARVKSQKVYGSGSKSKDEPQEKE